MRHVILKRFLVVLSMLVAGVSAPVFGQLLGLHFEGNRSRARIPFEIHNNLIIIPVVVNGILPLNFIVDSGVRSNIIVDKAYTDFLGVNYSRVITLYGLGMEKQVNAYIANNVTLEMEGIAGTGQSILVLETDLLQFRNYLGTEVHGIIGYEIFNRFVVQVNYASSELILHDPVTFKKRRRYRTVPMEVIDTKPYVDVPLFLTDTTSIHAKLMIDTGASHALVLKAGSHPLIEVPKRNVRAKLGRGLAGEIEGYLGRVKALEIADYQLTDVISSYPDKNMYFDTLLLKERNGSIGGEVLRKFNVVFDYFRGNLYLKKNPGFKTPFEYNMSGLEVMARGDDLDQFVVHHVRPGSPGDSVGIEAGDQILIINHLEADNISLTRIYGILNSKVERKIRMVINRNGERKRFTFRLKREI